MDKNWITSQMRELRRLGNEPWLSPSVRKVFSEAADTIEVLCVKLSTIDKERLNEGWIYCGDGKNLPEKYMDEDGCHTPFLITPKYDSSKLSAIAVFNGKHWENGWGKVEVIAWRPFPEFYRHIQRNIGEDYKQQIMSRFMRTE